MLKSSVFLALLLLASASVSSQQIHNSLPLIRAGAPYADYRIGDRTYHGRWRISPEVSPDVIPVRIDSGRIVVAFITDRDSIVRTLTVNDSLLFYVLLDDGRYALTEFNVASYPVYPPLKTTATVHEHGRLIGKPVSVTFVSGEGVIRNKYINSITVCRFDSIVYHDNNPDRSEIAGTPYPTHIQRSGDSLLIAPFSPEYYMMFIGWHSTRALEYYDSLFHGLLDFPGQSGFSDIRILFGHYNNSSPATYVFSQGVHLSPTLVYHEIGHRAFWQLQDTLHIGPVGSYVHMGLLEYFTVSLADYPVVLEGLVPAFQVRDASKPDRYPDGFLNYADLMTQYYAAYKDSFEVGPAYKRQYEVEMHRIRMWDSTMKTQDAARKIIEAHKSGMMITHPLWELRSRIGRDSCDALVVAAMKAYPSLIAQRREYLAGDVKPRSDGMEWYDLVNALRVVDRRLYNGSHVDMITSLFTESGFDCMGKLKQP